MRNSAFVHLHYSGLESRFDFLSSQDQQVGSVPSFDRGSPVTNSVVLLSHQRGQDADAITFTVLLAISKQCLFALDVRLPQQSIIGLFNAD